MALRLTEEVGEVAREINHLYGPKKRKQTENKGDLEGELADVIFTICCIANKEGIDLPRAWQNVMEKHYGRDANRYEKKE